MRSGANAAIAVTVVVLTWWAVPLASRAQDGKAQQRKTQWDGVYSDPQAKRGAQVYSDVCAVCHTPTLFGSDLAPALTSAALAVRWGNKPLADLFEYMQGFMPLNSPGGLTRQQNADILAFMLQKAKFPAGAAELSSEAGTLRQIWIADRKP
jgi:S-disulfanyl-L-cysteine oxidoreductase SoxD